ncbi:MAG TPA: alpha/beta fold hydrolase [Saprospiraceae bacterium]|nr:alpha/beta fold hydrolase [Saprospiraceae bacterium]
MNWLISLLLTGFVVLPLSQSLAQRQITIDDIWTNGTFRAKGVPGFRFMNDGHHYTALQKNMIVKYDLRTGDLVDTILNISTLMLPASENQIDEYTFSDNETQLLLNTGTETIYRHSTKEWTYVYNLATSTITKLSDVNKQMHASISPDGKKVGFVMDNDLYFKDLKSGKTTRVTTDGKVNSIINGSCDWVYEEEFSFTKAFAWSPDSRHLAYYRFDESAVKDFTMTNYTGEMYPEMETFKYPKVGMENSKVSIHLYDTKTKKKVNVDRTSDPDGYIPRIKWTTDASKLCVFWMNRHQNHLDLLLANAADGKTTTLLQEDNKYYIDIHDNLTFLSDQGGFIWTSEKDGYNHIYLYNMDGTLKRQLTSGPWEVTGFYGIDEKNEKIYFQGNMKSPMEREIYSVALNGDAPVTIKGDEGTNTAEFSTTFDLFVWTHSGINTPASYAVNDRNGKMVRLLEDNAGIKKLQEEYKVQPVDFFKFTTTEGVELNGYQIKPYNFDPTRKYPVFMFLYGGPGSQEVVDGWMGSDYWWFQSLAQQGYIIACVDNRGTGGRGEEFKKMTYLQLGHYETIDQIEAAKYLGKLPYADASRIGIFGWSYGGYMSSLCLFKGNDVFNSAIAVAPVTNWKWYDSIYTERYMRDTKENSKGYEDDSPINFADKLTGNYLLVHGSSDDNVHFQNTAEMSAALIKANKQYDTYFYPNRNHGIYGDNARRHLYVKMTDFINEHLKPDHPMQFSNVPSKS